MMLRKTGYIFMFMISTSLAFPQDDTGGSPVSWGGGYGDECRIVILTETGTHLTTSRARARVIATNGILVKVGKADALGFAVLLSLDDRQGWAQELRFRHWFSRSHSVDLGIGLPSQGGYQDGVLWRASPQLLLKWNPMEILGLALRPEHRNPTGWYLSGGLEICGPPAFAVEGIAVLLLASAMNSMW